MEDNSKNFSEIKIALNQLKINQLRIEKQFSLMLIIILCLLIFLFIGLISIVEVTRNDVFENLKLLFFVILIFLAIFGLYKYFQVGNKEAKLQIKSKIVKGEEINAFKKYFLYFKQYYYLTILLFTVLMPSIIIYLVLSIFIPS